MASLGQLLERRDLIMLKLCYREHQINTANLYLQKKRVSRISSLTPSLVSIAYRSETEYQQVQDFIKRVYLQSYQADIEVSYPALMSLRNGDGEILAAVGFRCAEQSSLFLEQYTQEPIEKKLDCARCEIVEIGNLASAGKGASIFLFAALATYLNERGVRYAAITGTDFLHRYFKRIGLNPYKMCDAEMSAVEDGGQSWGSYYETRPRVLIGSIDNGVQRLRVMLGAKFENHDSATCLQSAYLETAV